MTLPRFPRAWCQGSIPQEGGLPASVWTNAVATEGAAPAHEAPAFAQAASGNSAYLHRQIQPEEGRPDRLLQRFLIALQTNAFSFICFTIVSRRSVLAAVNRNRRTGQARADVGEGGCQRADVNRAPGARDTQDGGLLCVCNTPLRHGLPDFHLELG